MDRFASRFVKVRVLISDPNSKVEGDEGYDEKVHEHPETKWAWSSIDLWEIEKVREGWEKGDIELVSFNGDSQLVQGTWNHWNELHQQAKRDELYIRNFPFSLT